MNKFKQYRQAKTEYAYSLFKNRQSFEKVRALIIKDNKILLVHKIASNIYSLPGGGVENGENYQMAVERECYEEAKAKVKFKSVVGILNYDVNMTCKSEKFLSTRIEYYCWCDFISFIKNKKFFGLNGEFFEKVEVVWQSLDQIEKCGLNDYIVDKIRKIQAKISQNKVVKTKSVTSKQGSVIHAFTKGQKIKNATKVKKEVCANTKVDKAQKSKASANKVKKQNKLAEKNGTN